MDETVPLRVTVLGGLALWRGDDAVPVPGARLQRLVVRTALAGGCRLDPAVLVDAVWAEDPPAGAAHALQALVSRLRRVLGPAAVEHVAGGYRLEVDEADVDALRFEALAAAGQARLRESDPAAAATALGEAVALWGDRPGVEPSAVAAVAPAVATRLAEVSVEAVVDLADAELALGRAEAAATRLSALLSERPAHERAAALLLDALAAQGRQADALAWYERTRSALADVLGADPGAALRERHLRLLRDEQPAPAADAVRAGPSTLPAPLTSFVGRDDDLARVAALLTGGRLVTVLGPGGAGKTRLAVEAARHLGDEFSDGVRMINLASLTEPAEVVAAVLAGTGRRGGALFDGRTRGGGHELDALVDELGCRQCLLVIDNCEHLIEAVAQLVAALLPRCPELRVLATSREPLAIDGEALVPLGPLDRPGPGDDVEAIRSAAAVRLFTERAAAVRPGFEVDETTLPEIRQVVGSLDGLPLALELAAARLRTLSLPELAVGLSDRFGLLTTGSRAAPPRHRTLGAVIAWSWELLGEHERTVAERVAVLPGGVTPAAAAAVCAGTVVTPVEIPELLAGLVDRSILQLTPEPGRYRMLETIREYGLERLAAAGELGATRDLAARHVAELLARHDPRLRGPDQAEAMRVIAAEYENALAALRRRCDDGDADGAVALALLLCWYWQMVGRSADAAHWLGEVLAVPGGAPSPARACAEAVRLLSRVDTGLTTTADEAGDDATATRAVADRLLALPDLPSPYVVYGPILLHFLEDERTALAIFDRLAEGPDVWLCGLAHMFRAEIVENSGELAAMRLDVQAAVERFQQVGDRWGQASVLPMRAQLRAYDGDLDGALADLAEARSLAEEFGLLSPADQLHGDLHRIDLLLRRGDTEPALAMIDVARDRAGRARSPQMLCLLDAREAEFRLRLGDQDRARERLEEAERGLTEVGPVRGAHVRTLAAAVRATLCLESGDPAGAQAALTSAYATARETRDLPLCAAVAMGVAALAEAQGRHHDLAVLLGVAARLRGAEDRSDPRVRELTRRCRVALDEEAFAAAYATGRGLTGQDAVTTADPGGWSPGPLGLTP